MFKFDRKIKITYITESADWIIKRIGIELQKRIKNSLVEFVIVDNKDFASKSNVIHIGSRSAVSFNDIKEIRKKADLLVLTWFHGDDKDIEYIEGLKRNQKFIDKIHTASNIQVNKLIGWGIPESKIQKIHLGVDNDFFSLATPGEKEAIRTKLGVSPRDLLIGSFQKDGDGWGEGMNPKLIKGPDIFCNVVEKIAKDYPVKVLLTGPSRGYVMNRLQTAKIPFVHDYLQNYENIVDYYKALDCYLVCSRNEGGPMSILESFATGVPVISSKVGMAEELIKDSINGYLYETANEDNCIEKFLAFANQKNYLDMKSEAKFTALENDWDKISVQYWKSLYGI